MESDIIKIKRKAKCLSMKIWWYLWQDIYLNKFELPFFLKKELAEFCDIQIRTISNATCPLCKIFIEKKGCPLSVNPKKRCKGFIGECGEKTYKENFFTLSNFVIWFNRQNPKEERKKAAFEIFKIIRDWEITDYE